MNAAAPNAEHDHMRHAAAQGDPEAIGVVFNYNRNQVFRGVPQGAAAVDEANIRRVGYMQQAMVTMMCALLTAMVAKYVHGIKVEHDGSKEEKEYVERMFSLFSFHWILVTSMNFLLA